MAFSNTFNTGLPPNTGSGVSNREDLTDVLTILAPEETPILSSANKQKASATFVEWTVDSLAGPSSTPIREGADVGQTIGDDADAGFVDKFAGRARLGNYIQKFRRAYQVSDLQEAVDSVGPAKVAQAEAKAIRELKRDIEFTLSGSQARAAEDGVNQGYQLAGLGAWIDSAASTSLVPTNFRTPASSEADVTVAEGSLPTTLCLLLIPLFVTTSVTSLVSLELLTKTSATSTMTATAVLSSSPLTFTKATTVLFRL
jgi:hypothetical protein